MNLLKKIVVKDFRNIEFQELSFSPNVNELLGMKVIDELIFEEVSYYKEVYKEKGLKGLIDALGN